MVNNSTCTQACKRLESQGRCRLVGRIQETRATSGVRSNEDHQNFIQPWQKTQTALVHALSYAETALNQKNHGQSCAYWLPYVWQLLIESDCDPKILLSLNQAVDQFFSTPVEMHQW
jgi:hypothetical protein